MNKSYCDCCDSGNKNNICSNKIKDNTLKFIHWDEIRPNKNSSVVDCIYNDSNNNFYFIEFKNFKWFLNEKTNEDRLTNLQNKWNLQ